MGVGLAFTRRPVAPVARARQPRAPHAAEPEAPAAEQAATGGAPQARPSSERAPAALPPAQDVKIQPVAQTRIEEPGGADTGTQEQERAAPQAQTQTDNAPQAQTDDAPQAQTAIVRVEPTRPAPTPALPPAEG